MTEMKNMHMAETGTLPEDGLLAVSYVPFQKTDSPQYQQDDALKNGTLFPGLNLPYGKFVPNKEIADTPQGELMAVSFVIDELGLYLDTHPNDMQALSLRNNYVRMYNEAKEKYQQMHGPITQDTVMPLSGGYSWLNNPWPWDQEKEADK